MACHAPSETFLNMRIVLQRVSRAEVRIDGAVRGGIGRGLMLLVGVHQNSLLSDAAPLALKCADLRIFPDMDGKMNLSARDLQLGALVVSQFTLYADCSRGRRPNFIAAAPPALAIPIYEAFVTALKAHLPNIETGVFGEMMEVDFVNDGPVTLILENLPNL